MADALGKHEGAILAANARDVAAAREAGTDAGIVDRLTLTPERLAAIADALRALTSLVDPVGEVVRGYTLPNGLRLTQLRVPLGVVAMIYEARPNVTVDAAGLCLKSGNAALLRGSASAYHTNVVLVQVLAEAATSAGVPSDAIALVPGVERASVTALLGARGLVDVVIPRGGAGLIQHVVENSTVPVIETGVGNCHVYVDASAELEVAQRVILNAKVQRPSVCNAAETLLVHSEVAPALLPGALRALAEAGVTLHGDEATRAFAPDGVTIVPATDEDWATEYLSLDLAVRVVASLDEAIEHIARWSSHHTEAILATDARAINEFTARVDSAAIAVNASTRFTDGEEFGFGAEIGISTQKLHARGPMGLPELTSTKYIVVGEGHIR
jgi:glutamate-5-semialdehyde dehydrogenase